MITSRITFLFLAFTPALLLAQAPNVEWSFNYGGTNAESGRAICRTSDGGYLVGGSTQSGDGDVVGHQGQRDIWLIKLLPDGTIDWQRTLGGSFNEGIVVSIRETADAGFVVGGTTSSVDGDVECVAPTPPRAWIVKTDAWGNIQWQRCLGGDEVESLSSIALVDGDIVMTGGTYSSNGDAVGNQGLMDAWVVRLDMDGNTIWTRCFGGSKNDTGTHVAATSDGGCIVAGYTQSNDGDLTGINPYYSEPVSSHTGWVLKLDNDGNIQWQRCYGGSNGDFFRAIREAPNGTYWVVGNTGSNDGDVEGNHGGGDAWVLRLDANGNLMQQRCLGGSNAEQFNGLHVLPNGSALVIGYTNSTDGDITQLWGGVDAWTILLSPDLEVQWQRTIGGTALDHGYGIDQSHDGGGVLTGYTTSEDGDLTGNNGGADLWVVKLAPWDDTGLPPDHTVDPLQVFPNPVGDQLWVRHDALSLAGFPWTVTDLTGRTMLQGRFGAQQNMLSVEGLAPGAYHLLVGSGAQQVTARFIKQ